MSRTTRKRPKGRGVARDGDDLRPSRGCRHHGTCDYCVATRTYAAKHQDPIEGLDALEWQALADIAKEINNS